MANSRLAIIAKSNSPYGPNNLGLVLNIIVGDSGYQDPSGNAVVVSNNAGIGWTYDGTTFSPPAEPAPTAAQLTSSAQQAWSTFLSLGQTFNVAAAGQPAVNVLCDGTSSTRADLALLALYAENNPEGQKTWTDNNGVSTILTSPQLVQLATLAGNWISDTYPALSTLLGQIQSGEVTSYAQVEAFPWPTS